MGRVTPLPQIFHLSLSICCTATKNKPRKDNLPYNYQRYFLRLTNSFNSYWRQKEQKDTLLISELSPSTTLRFSLSAKFSLLANQSHQKGPFLTLRAQCLTISRPPHICLSLSSLTLSFCILHSYVFFCPLSLVCCPPVVHLVCPPCRRCLRRPSTTRD